MNKHHRPKIGLALGSGSARGWSHIGVLKRLAELGLKPDIIAGASVGALVGAAYASGNLHTLERWVRTLARFDIIRLLDPRLSGGGFIHGESLMSAIGLHVGDQDIAELETKFSCVATDLNSGQEVWLSEGSLHDAIRASIALPGVFTPVWRDRRWLIDGGLVNPVPISLARAMGADIIIAINLNGELMGRRPRLRDPGPEAQLEMPPVPEPEEPVDDSFFARTLSRLNISTKLESMIGSLRGDPDNTPTPPGLFDVLTASINIMQDRITRSRMAGDPPDIVIAPRLAHIRLMEFDRAAEAIEEGEKAVDRRADEIKALFEEADTSV